MSTVGIDGMELWAGKLELDLPGTLAPTRGEDPEKYTKGLGLEASSLPDTYEDIVTMGANAAYSLMKRRGLTPEDIGRIDVATESAFDHSKPASTYIAGCLESVLEGDFHHANKGERKFACVSGTQSVNDAFNWIQANRHRNRAALVIATDTALYARGDAGEATQGAGAVALLIDEEPELLALSHEQGYGSADETDFLKPNQQFPSVDGHRSIQVYLARMREALADYEGMVGELHPDDYAYIPFHTPFPGMVRKAAPLGYRRLIRGTEIEEELAGDIGHQPRRESAENDETFQEAMEQYMVDLQETERYQSWYESAIEPTLGLSRTVGNWYTGSVHLARASALLAAFEDDHELTGQRMLVASYGSGAQAEVHAETVQPGWREHLSSLDIFDQLDNRRSISFSEYERIHDVHNHDVETGSDVEPLTDPSGEFVFEGWGRMGERKYRFVD